MTASLQERFAPGNTCYGCGQDNPQGLQIRSFPAGDAVVLDWQPATHHEAIHGVLNGGVIATLFDCHMAWTAAWALRDEGGDELPLAVTAELSVSYLRPTPSAPPLRIEARLVELSGPRVVVEAELTSDAKVRATSRGVFVPTADSLRGAARDTTGPADARDA
jgi:uncharacterized protein (TIGR00369 family)